MSLMSFSGGIIYHLRALLFRNTLWKEHQEKVREFLSAWSPNVKHLILIGPSGGYSLPAEFLKKFSTVTAYDPDRLARCIFDRRMGIRVRWIFTPFDPENIPADFVIEPESAILFCNVLGQVKINDFSRYRIALLDFLKGREWASYHDAYSEKLETSSEIEVCEHESFDLFENQESLRFFYWVWRLSGSRNHLVEGVFQVYNKA